MPALGQAQAVADAAVQPPPPGKKQGTQVVVNLLRARHAAFGGFIRSGNRPDRPSGFRCREMVIVSSILLGERHELDGSLETRAQQRSLWTSAG